MTATPPDAREVAQAVDQSIAVEVWAPRQDSVSGSSVLTQADDATFLRRLTFDLAGRPPSIEEIRSFQTSQDANKRRVALRRLLQQDTFGQRWAHYWRDVVLSRRIDERSLVVRPAFDEYLEQAFNENRPWDEIARELILAEGDVQEEGATGVIMAQLGKPEETVAELSRVLLGIQIQCAQCHDHPFDRWDRDQFHELAAFFPRVAVRPQRQKDQRTFVVYGRDFEPRRRRQNNANRYQGTLEHRMPDLADPEAPGTVMEPTFFVSGDGLPLGSSDQDRRQFLADAFTTPDNLWFARAFVNRVWTEMVGESFYPQSAVDDIGPDRENVAPQTLDLLGNAFVASGYDVKWLFETIALTDAYGRKSESRRSDAPLPFAANHPRRLQSFELFAALAQAAAVPARVRSGNAGRGGSSGGRRVPQALFDRAFGFDPSLPPERIETSIPQTLQLMNGKIIQRFIEGRHPGSVSQLCRSSMDDGQMIDALYLRCLSRTPSRIERSLAERQIRRANSREEGLQDLLWALINSAEFLYRS